MLFKSSWLIHPVRHQWCIIVNWTLYPQYWVYSFRLTSIFCFVRITVYQFHTRRSHSKCNFVRATLKIHEACCAEGIEFEILLWMILHCIYILHICCIRMRVKGSFYFGRSMKTSPFTSSLDNPVFHYWCLIRCYLHFGWEFSQVWQED